MSKKKVTSRRFPELRIPAMRAWIGIAVIGVSTVICRGAEDVATNAAGPAPAEQTAAPTWTEAVIETRQFLREGLRLGPWYARPAAADGKERAEDMLATFKAAGDAGEPAGWRRLTESPGTHSIRLEGDEGSVFWLCRTLDMPRSNAWAILYQVVAEADWELWINGGRSVAFAKRFADPQPPPAHKRADPPSVTPGRNLLMLRVARFAGAPTLSFRLADKTNAHWVAAARQGLESRWPDLMDDLKRDLVQTTPAAWLVADDWAARLDAALARGFADYRKRLPELGIEAEATG